MQNERLFGRRECIAATGTALIGLSTVPGTSVAKSNSGLSTIETENGLLITKPNGDGITKGHVAYARNVILSLPKSEGESVHVIDSEKRFEEQNRQDTVAYYVEWKKKSPTERFWSAPFGPGESGAEEVVEKAKTDVAGVNVASVGSASVDPDDGWDEIGNFADHVYVDSEDVDGNEYVSGRIDMNMNVYRGEDYHPDDDDIIEYACGLSGYVWPGTYLDDQDSAVDDGRGLNKSTTVEQNWVPSITSAEDVELVDFSPNRNESGGYSLSNITVGVSPSGPYGEVTVDTSNNEVDSIENQSDPGKTVETEYGYGSPTSHADRGGDETCRVSNAGIFKVDSSASIFITDGEIKSEFIHYSDNDYPSDSIDNVVTDYEP
ncbi:uncharacterized protein Nmag_2762 [Natrialba magadii ATCC 43099]|uniref:Uncharacterized protein n=1 Tax=Natrialba magadii (strain ATCC 43099 / DSM 3394 / CCM 3739 / CIP 104546 / IAM 13178 / JCM 8861 / NBRC 102185 / NCIMB 2190 / MS3) TaxID=547559 RepID=D3SZQ8_NATMM|nr:hypothetical protein [Natrialba magadii]ADD06318.1 uncharacterized protein Nmag_2762 [Natrialba magadii ATCC 43099]ELY31246.1 hypothetical protein C500_06581 [Natrialba magadii ATCC 43099]